MVRVVVGSILGAAFALSCFPKSSWACTGTIPQCAQCSAPTCSVDVPQWHCEPTAAGTACNDGNACTGPDTCDGAGTCGGPPSINCSLSNGTGTCAPASGQCSYTCNNGYQLSGSTCVAVPANATITAPSATTAGTAGLSASVPNQPGATYAWSISAGGTITAGLGTRTV